MTWDHPNAPGAEVWEEGLGTQPVPPHCCPGSPSPRCVVSPGRVLLFQLEQMLRGWPGLAAQLSGMPRGAGAPAAWQAEAKSSHRTAGLEVPTAENVDVGLKWGFQLPSPTFPLKQGQVMVGSRQALPATLFVKTTAPCK